MAIQRVVGTAQSHPAPPRPCPLLADGGEEGGDAAARGSADASLAEAAFRFAEEKRSVPMSETLLRKS